MERGSDLYTNEEIVLLREELHRLDRQGRISPQTKYLPTDGTFRFSVELYLRHTSRLQVGPIWEGLGRLQEVPGNPQPAYSSAIFSSA